MQRTKKQLAITLHWRSEGAGRSTTVACDDCAPRDLIPLLLTGCQLPVADTNGRQIDYVLRYGIAGSRSLDSEQALGAQGVNSGSHLWLGPASTSATSALRRRCLLGLPGGSALLVPEAGLDISRGWLLQALGLLDPAAQRSELALLAQGDSVYRYVSRQTHCAIFPHDQHDWAVQSERSDVICLHNGVALRAHTPAVLGAGDRLQPGIAGPTLTIGMMQH